MSGLAVAVFALPLATGALGVLLHRHRAIQRLLSLVVLVGVLACALALVGATRGATVLSVDVGGFPPGLAIVLGVDALSALMLSIGSLMTLLGVTFAAASGEDDHPLFHPLVMFLWTGVALSFVTADLFNLFVAFEVMLIASYVLLTLRGGRDQVRAGVIYVGTNLLASTLFLLGVGLIYGATGTVNIAGVAAAIPEDPAAFAGLTVLLIAVAAKASLVPLHGWLPRTYVHASPAVTAIFSALLTKAGVYVLYRLTSTMLADVDGFLIIALVVAAVTMVVGVLGAVGGHDMRGILTFHMVSQVGYLVLPLGIWTRAAVAAGLFYLLQYVAVKGALFLAAGAVHRLEGTDDLDELGGLMRVRPWLGIAFLLPALALAGLPPSSGFIGKFLLVRAAFEAGAFWAGATAVAVSLLTLLSMIKIFNGAFWGQRPDDAPARPVAPTAVRARLMVALPLTLGLATIVLGLGATGLLDLVGEAADALIDPSAYLAAVTR
jgi:multicomponent Na+:H+ antiporter subunit D